MTFEVKRRLNAFVDLSSTDLTTLYTCPTNKTAVIKEIFICWKKEIYQSSRGSHENG